MPQGFPGRHSWLPRMTKSPKVPPEVIWLIACGCQRKHYYPRDTLASWQILILGDLGIVWAQLPLATCKRLLEVGPWRSFACRLKWFYSRSEIRHWLETPVNRPLVPWFSKILKQFVARDFKMEMTRYGPIMEHIWPFTILHQNRTSTG